MLNIVRPSGVLDSTQGINFRKEINHLINNNATIIIVDFQNVTFMDSSGLGALVLSLKMAKSHGTKLFLCSINDQIRMLLELTSMDKIFEIFPNLETLKQQISQS
ncbi:anti-sigma-factor antagonist [Rippkaea orientalis PCC 8801]|uniref:Anti-sigma factor antagonist n=1 Tax=Rippkaea orientalis (strain PCC 8801 / RF-1) TaxID=41431 RepID=B7JXS2_RIPO1|nr:STAS domain-containing protein [Rippkaea orientalis]ACK65886.1 anti-sigma-factor antagonist [Rippkaea orientalis PCC 8801]